ncbi:MAG: adenosylcobinamide-GDP ribazoletransferase [Desulfobacterales bacterium]|nr:adenosylcobinamide-GDP ribazoletransferase [Desulfobacterales bacterium]
MRRRLMKYLRAAIQFITILPAGKTAAYHPREMIAYFPVVGLILGLVLAVSDALFLQLWPGGVVPAVLDVVLLVILTGALHLDGLADSADGLLGHRDQKTVLSIMKDSRIGVMGMVAVFCALAVKFAGIAAMPLHASFQRLLILLLVPGLARSSMIFGIHLLPYGRPGGGTGFDLFEAPIHFKDFWGLGICLLLCLFLGWRGLWIILVFFGLVFGIVFYYRRRMGCITGDMLGAMTEATESLMFLLACIGGMGSP